MPKKEKSTFSHFFKDDAPTIQSVINGKTDEQIIDKVGTANKAVFPKISSSKEVAEGEYNAQWRSLRSFFRNGNSTEGLTKNLSPVIMSPIYTDKIVGTDFPVWVADEKFEGDGALCLSLKEILVNSLNEIAPGEEEATILKANIERIINIANEELGKQPQLFETAILNILNGLEKQLDVTGDAVKDFNKSLNNLKKVLPSNGALLPYSNNTSLQILEAALVTSNCRSRSSLEFDTTQLICRLNDLLRVEREKNPEKFSSGKKSDSKQVADSLVNFEEISSIMPDAGSESMGEERIKHITSIVKELEKAEKILNQKGFLFVDELLFNNEITDWENLFGEFNVETFKEGSGCDAVSTSFNNNIKAWTNLFIAKRKGELEFNNTYLPDVHDDYFEHFTWENFSTEELINCPHFILIADDSQLFNTELNKVSSVLSKNIPVKIVAVKRDYYGIAKDPYNLHTQTELAALMISHKNIYVAQSTSITPQYLFKGFKEGLNAFAPAFFNILNVDESIHENTYLWTSATVESREFPGFTFNGKLGTPWGSRFDIENNPQPNLHWPIHELNVINAEGEKVEMVFPFTLADQIAINPGCRQHFMPVNSSYWSDSLILLTDYIENSVEDNIGNIPFIWMIDTNNELQKVAVSWSIVLATQERLDFWRFLQENSGIDNYHVKQAVEQAKAEMQDEFNKDIEKLKEEHESEIQSIKAEESELVMENLASVLLNLDTSNVSVSSTPAPSVAQGDATVEAAPVDVKEEESVLSNDPYIDTALCTSCNECLDINAQMFKYNADKMAYIADAKAGTFSQLVDAAEICPVSVIHPGSPLNPDEPDLDSLIERAKDFN